LKRIEHVVSSIVGGDLAVESSLARANRASESADRVCQREALALLGGEGH
jgi:hypothetical protein